MTNLPNTIETTDLSVLPTSKPSGVELLPWRISVGSGFVVAAGDASPVSLVGHTHAIADVTGLQTAIDAKFDKTGGNVAGNVIATGSLSAGVSLFTPQAFIDHPTYSELIWRINGAAQYAMYVGSTIAPWMLYEYSTGANVLTVGKGGVSTPLPLTAAAIGVATYTLATRPSASSNSGRIIAIDDIANVLDRPRYSLQQSDGTTWNWIDSAGVSGGSGTVTAVGVSVPTGLTVSGSPVTTSGTIAIGLAANRVIPLQSELDAKAATSYVDAGLAGKANTSHTHAISDVTGLTSALSAKADLVGGLVPSSQLPSFVDDVLEYANLAAFPGTGESGKIYVALDTNRTYRWSGSAYVEISASPGSTDAVVEGATNLYFTNERVDDRVAALLQNGTGITWSYNDGSGTLTPTVSLASFSTSNLTEGSNLYFTDERVDDRVNALLIAGAGLSKSYDDSGNALTLSVLGGAKTGFEFHAAGASGGVLTTGVKKFTELVRHSMTITNWIVIGDTVGSIVIDIKVNGVSITGSAKPTISSATSASSSALTGWATTLTAGDLITYEIVSVSSFTHVGLFVEGNKT